MGSSVSHSDHGRPPSSFLAAEHSVTHPLLLTKPVQLTRPTHSLQSRQTKADRLQPQLAIPGGLCLSVNSGLWITHAWVAKATSYSLPTPRIGVLI